MTGKRWKMVAGAVAAAVALGLGAMVGGGVVEDDAASSVTPPSIAAGEAGPAPGLPEGMTEHRDQAAGFAIGYPADWQVLESTDPQVSLVASRNQKDSLLVRVVRLTGPVGPAELPQFKSVTEEVVRANQGVEVLEGPREVEVGGLPGYFYLYRFTDTASGERGAHSHYFLFRDATMITMVFQALPEASFAELAPVFDRVASTFRTL